jgi:hypothetical protein
MWDFTPHEHDDRWIRLEPLSATWVYGPHAAPIAAREGFVRLDFAKSAPILAGILERMTAALVDRAVHAHSHYARSERYRRSS